MSYILDALKKSEAERQQGKAPGVGTVQSYQPHRVKRRRVWPYLIVIALAINAGVVLVALHPWEEPVEPTPKATREAGLPEMHGANPLGPVTPLGSETSREKLAAVSPKATPSSEPARAGAPSTPAAPAGEAGPSTSAPPAGKSTVSSSPESPAEASSPAPAITPPAVVPRTTSAGSPSPPAALENPAGKASPALSSPTENRFSSRDRGGSSKVTDDPARGSATAQRSFAAEPPAVPKAAETTRIPAVAAAPPAVEKPQRPAPPPASTQEQLPPVDSTPPRSRPQRDQAASRTDGPKELHDMPAGIRHEVPRLTFSFLVYSDRPEERMVTINGKRVREGEEVISGLRLEEITPEGAILNWKGQRFHKSVF